MHRRPVVRLVLAPLLAIAVALALGSWAAGREPDSRSGLASALDALPRGTLVAGFTDWAAIRSALDLGSASTAAGRSALSNDASLRDLTTRSVLAGAIADMHQAYGWSAADLDWESYGQSPSGAVMVGRFSDDVSIGAVEKRLGTLGYSRRGQQWTIDPDGSGNITPELATTLAYLAIDPQRRLVVAADRPAYVPTVLSTIRGERRSALADRALADVANALGGSDSAVIQGEGFGCRATALTALGPDVQAQAAAAVARAGDLVSPTFTGRGLVDGPRTQSIRFVSAYGSSAEASDQTRVRATLATGPFIGRTGRVEDSLVLRDATTSGTVSTLRFALDPDRGAYMSGEGALLFASCP